MLCALLVIGTLQASTPPHEVGNKLQHPGSVPRILLALKTGAPPRCLAPRPSLLLHRVVATYTVKSARQDCQSQDKPSLDATGVEVYAGQSDACHGTGYSSLVFSEMLDHVNVLLFSNPSWNGAGTVSSTTITNISALSSGMAYSARFTGDTTVLSTRYAGTANGVIAGLLYVPDLPSDDSCIYETAHHVPLSAVHQANLPPMNYHLIAIAPWVNGRCANAYLTSALTAPVRAFLFYLPGADAGPPPPADSPDWYIQDRADWMTETGYPVYAVSSMAGQVMMQHLSLYSGNMSEVPFGHNITERFLSGPNDYLRIWTELDITTHTAAFDTWVYALIIVGLLLTVITTTSLLMHFARARARASLRRRVMAGDVNLEAMGIKRLTVPMEHIQRFPLFTYNYEPEASSPPLSPRSAKTAWTRTRTHCLGQTLRITAPMSSTVSEHGLTSPLARSRTATDYQPNCEICLELFENRATVIRELPCRHIFHPECIDEFLLQISSLCPICKTSMLPEGYCPKITNALVRRERAIRRLRSRVEDFHSVDEGTCSGKPQGWWKTTKSRIFGAHSSDPLSSTSTELQEAQPRPSGNRPPQPVRLQLLRSSYQDGAGRQGGAPTALARERMRELAGFQPDYGEAGMTIWKRIRSQIFPGFN